MSRDRLSRSVNSPRLRYAGLPSLRFAERGLKKLKVISRRLLIRKTKKIANFNVL